MNKVGKVLNKSEGIDILKEFDESKHGRDFWDMFLEFVESTHNVSALNGLKNKVVAQIEDQVLYVLANSIQTVEQ